MMSKPTLKHRFEEEDQLHLKKAVIGIFSVSLAISIAVGVALLANNNRQKIIIKRYTQETTSLIEENAGEFKELFTATLDSCKQDLVQANLVSEDHNLTDVVCELGQQRLAKIGVDQLKDSSAIAYMRVSGENYELLEASGKYSGARPVKNSYHHFHYRNRDKMYDFLVLQQSIPMWDDYISFIPRKEVIVPVILEDNKTVGYIFRGVIEK